MFAAIRAAERSARHHGLRDDRQIACRQYAATRKQPFPDSQVFSLDSLDRRAGFCRRGMPGERPALGDGYANDANDGARNERQR
jgi:hypothetical protein